MSRFKVGDRVKLNARGLQKYSGGYKATKEYIIEKGGHAEEGLCIYNDRRTGWIHEELGLFKYIERIKDKIIIGGNIL